MTFFKNLFGSSESDTTNVKVNWVALTDINQLNEIVLLSNRKPVAIFKHSTTCNISRMALKQFENEFDLNEKITLYFLDLLNHRDISNEIASRFKVVHQSPQLILIKNGIATYNVSHESIDAEKLKKKA